MSTTGLQRTNCWRLFRSCTALKNIEFLDLGLDWPCLGLDGADLGGADLGGADLGTILSEDDLSGTAIVGRNPGIMCRLEPMGDVYNISRVAIGQERQNHFPVAVNRESVTWPIQ